MGLLTASTLQDIARIWVNELTNTKYLKSLEVCFGYLYHHKSEALQIWVLLDLRHSGIPKNAHFLWKPDTSQRVPHGEGPDSPSWRRGNLAS